MPERMPDRMLFAKPVEVHKLAIQGGLRRYRPGPDATGFSKVYKFLRSNFVDFNLAADRSEWQRLEVEWISAFPVQQCGRGENVVRN